MAGEYTITLSDGVTIFTIYPLEVNGEGKNSANRKIQIINSPLNPGTNYFAIAGDLTYRFVPGFTFEVVDSSGSLNDGPYTVVPGGSTFDSTNTLIPVVESIPSNAVPLGYLNYTIPTGEVISSLSFPGRGMVNYGQDLIENQLKQTEHFSNTTEPANAISGQLWFKSDTDKLFLRNAANDAWISVTTEPAYEEAIAGAGQTIFPTTINTIANGGGNSYLQVFVNGVLQQEGGGKDYTVTGTNQFTFNAGLTASDDVVMYSFA